METRPWPPRAFHVLLYGVCHCPPCAITSACCGDESGVAYRLVQLQVGSEQQVNPAGKDPGFRQSCPVLISQGREDQQTTPNVDRRRVHNWFFY